MSILALDLGKQTGWAILNGGVIQSGSESFHGSRFSGGGMQFLNFRKSSLWSFSHDGKVIKQRRGTICTYPSKLTLLFNILTSLLV